MMTDPIADMLTRIRNAQLSRKENIEMSFSKMKKGVLDILQREGYVGAVSVEEGDVVKKLLVVLKYQNREPAIRSIVRESKPGHRLYCKSDEMPKVLNGFGIAIVSTSRGLMTNKEARKAGVGGELICSVY